MDGCRVQGRWKTQFQVQASGARGGAAKRYGWGKRVVSGGIEEKKRVAGTMAVGWRRSDCLMAGDENGDSDG